MIELLYKIYTSYGGVMYTRYTWVMIELFIQGIHRWWMSYLYKVYMSDDWVIYTRYTWSMIRFFSFSLPCCCGFWLTLDPGLMEWPLSLWVCTVSFNFLLFKKWNFVMTIYWCQTIFFHNFPGRTSQFLKLVYYNSYKNNW